MLRALVQALEAVGGWIRPWDGWAPWAAVGVDPPAQIGLTPEERQRLERGDPLVLLLPTQVTGPATAALAAQGYGGLLVVPLPGESEPVGVLSLLYAGPPPPDAPERAARLAPLAALVLQQARAARVRVYTIGMGTGGDPSRFRSGHWGVLDEETLRAVAELTGGRYWHATSARDLRAIYRSLAGTLGWTRQEQEVSAVAALAAAAVLVLALLARGRLAPAT